MRRSWRRLDADACLADAAMDAFGISDDANDAVVAQLLRRIRDASPPRKGEAMQRMPRSEQRERYRPRIGRCLPRDIIVAEARRSWLFMVLWWWMVIYGRLRRQKKKQQRRESEWMKPL
mmetsp:Transcript_4323/g.12395  ORF Transcript_4323/g.12395 Transcript_4323/m.12395 type:complete len:119 (+) Transcript_4323:1024-1380(+)